MRHLPPARWRRRARAPSIDHHVRWATYPRTLLSEPEVQRTVLANGIRVITERMPEARSVTTGFWVAVGGRDEAAELAGASHFLEQLVFKGSARRSAKDIAEAVDAVGGEMNAYTSREHTA